MSHFLNLLVGLVIIIAGVIVPLLFYQFYFLISNGAVFVIAILIPLLSGIVGLGWVLGGWASVGAALDELWFKFKVWLLAHLLYGGRSSSLT